MVWTAAHRRSATAMPNRTRIDTPHTLADAIVAYEADTVLCEAMGADLKTGVHRDPSRRGRTLGGGLQRVVDRRDHRLGTERILAVAYWSVEPRGKQSNAVQCDVVKLEARAVGATISNASTPASFLRNARRVPFEA